MLTVRTELGTTVSGVVVGGTDQYIVYAGTFTGPVVLSGLIAPPPGQPNPLIEYHVVCGGPTGEPTPTTTTTAPSALANTGNTPSSATVIGLVSAGVALVGAGLTILLVVRHRRAGSEA